MTASLSTGGARQAAPIRRSGALSFGINLDWCLWVAGYTALEFVQYSQTIALYIFTIIVLIYFAKQPVITSIALYQGGIQWIVVALGFLSVLWSSVPDTSLRSALQEVLSFSAALALARGLPPSQSMTALMVVLLAPTAASILDPRMQMNAGAMALVGVFGSKNQFGLSQGLLLMASAWIWRDKERGLLVRALASMTILLALFMLVMARSVDSFAIAVSAIICGFIALKLNRIPPKWRLPIFWGAMIFVLAESAFFFAIADNLFGSILQAFGKDTTLTGRTIIWQTARKVWDENPFLGVGLNGFWVWGNAYAEDLWARFAPGRTGINFHNLWYEMVCTIWLCRFSCSTFDCLQDHDRSDSLGRP